MAYEMLTGNLPFAANTAWEWATQHMTVPPKDIDQMPFHERIPPRMKDALRKALQKSPDDRFATVRLFFDAFSGGAAANATPVAPPGQPAMGAAPAAAAKGKTGDRHAARLSAGAPGAGCLGPIRRRESGRERRDSGAGERRVSDAERGRARRLRRTRGRRARRRGARTRGCCSGSRR